MNKTKPFDISKKVVMEAYEQVKANQGTVGIDGQSIGMFEENLKNNLYKMWNRMSSRCYFPPPVKAVEIPKKNGGKSAQRILIMIGLLRKCLCNILVSAFREFYLSNSMIA